MYFGDLQSIFFINSLKNCISVICGVFLKCFVFFMNSLKNCISVICRVFFKCFVFFMNSLKNIISVICRVFLKYFLFFYEFFKKYYFSYLWSRPLYFCAVHLLGVGDCGQRRRDRRFHPHVFRTSFPQHELGHCRRYLTGKSTHFYHQALSET